MLIAQFLVLSFVLILLETQNSSVLTMFWEFFLGISGIKFNLFPFYFFSHSVQDFRISMIAFRWHLDTTTYAIWYAITCSKFKISFFITQNFAYLYIWVGLAWAYTWPDPLEILSIHTFPFFLRAHVNHAI